MQDVSFVIGEKTPDNVLVAFLEGWRKHFGLPEMIIVDQGEEFGGVFTEYCHSHGCLVHPIDSKSPWQNGKTERHGGLWKVTYDKDKDMVQPRNEFETRCLVSETTENKNRYSNRSGFFTTPKGVWKQLEAASLNCK